MVLPAVTFMFALMAPACDLDGKWTYTPECNHDYEWHLSGGELECFAGLDSWKAAKGTIVGSNLTLSFGDPSCPGAGPERAVKWGTISADCNLVTMHDRQPNCPVAGSCTYERLPRRKPCPGPRPKPPPPPPAPPCPASGKPLDVEWLSCRTKQIIEGCTLPITPTSPLNKGINASVAYTPDASHGYGAQWTRDFQYTVSGASGLMDEASVKASVRYTFAGMSAQGCMPDEVHADGKVVLSPGGPGDQGPYSHAWDNGPFAALLLASTATAWPDRGFFCDLEPSARKALDFVNRSSNGLVYNDPVHPNCTYGFTDGVAKTGNLFFCSLLYVDASRQMAALSAKYDCGSSAQYAKEAAAISSSIDATMKDPNGPLWLAATIDNRKPDIWGTAYLVALNLSTAPKRQAAMDEMVSHKDVYFLGGQARSIPYPDRWDRCDFTPAGQGDKDGRHCAAPGTYQNGAYWATPLPYLAKALLATGHAEFAEALLSDAIANFKMNGIFEDVDFGPTNPDPAYAHGVLNYTASATNALWAAQLLEKHRVQPAAK